MTEHITVDQPTAKRMKDAGWNKETALCYTPDGRCVYRVDGDGVVIGLDNDLSAPTLQEILDELDYNVFLGHFKSLNEEWEAWTTIFLYIQFSLYLFYTVRSAEKVAEVWLWKEGMK